MCAMRGWARKGPWGPEVDALAAACGWVRTKPLDRHGLSTPLELHCWEFDLQGPEINQRASSLEGFCWLANPALLGHPTPQATPLLLEMGNKAMGDKVGAGVGGGGGKRGRTGLRLQPVSASASESFRDVSSRLGCVHLRAPRRGTPWRQGHGTMLKWHSWRTTSGRGHGTRILS